MNKLITIWSDKNYCDCAASLMCDRLRGLGMNAVVCYNQQRGLPSFENGGADIGLAIIFTNCSYERDEGKNVLAAISETISFRQDLPILLAKLNSSHGNYENCFNIQGTFFYGQSDEELKAAIMQTQSS